VKRPDLFTGYAQCNGSYIDSIDDSGNLHRFINRLPLSEKSLSKTFKYDKGDCQARKL